MRQNRDSPTSGGAQCSVFLVYMCNCSFLGGFSLQGSSKAEDSGPLTVIRKRETSRHFWRASFKRKCENGQNLFMVVTCIFLQIKQKETFYDPLRGHALFCTHHKTHGDVPTLGSEHPAEEQRSVRDLMCVLSTHNRSSEQGLSRAQICASPLLCRER